MADIKLKMETTIPVLMDKRAVRTGRCGLYQIFTLSVLHQHEEKASRGWGPLPL